LAVLFEAGERKKISSTYRRNDTITPLDFVKRLEELF